MLSLTNQATSAAWDFHNATKYFLTGPEWDDSAFVMGDPDLRQPAMGAQNPANEPRAYKYYTSLSPIPLPRPEPTAPLSALDAIVASGDLPTGQAIPDLDTLARICLRANGLLKAWRSPAGRTIEFRAAGCTGARYHLELYLVCGNLPGLDAGIYHYGAHDHSLRQLRAGDYRGAVTVATSNEPAIVQAPVIMITTSTFWRNAWRYQARAYRHVFWDTGTVLGNLLAVAADAQLPARTVLGFVDAEINALLDVDGEHEAAIALVALGRDARTAPQSPPIKPLNLTVAPLATNEIEFPEIAAMREASSLRSAAEVETWRQPRPEPPPPEMHGDEIPLRPLAPDQLPQATIDEVIEHRRSYRKYDPAKPLSFAAFSTVLARSGRTTTFDCLQADDAPLTTRVLLVNAVDGLEPGIYLVNPDATAITPLRTGAVSELATELACYQDYAGDAHVNVYELADLDRALRLFGNRGYRVAQLEAAIAGAKLQLAAHAFGLGAVGSTSLDDRVTESLSPPTGDQSFMFVAVFGERLRKPVSGDHSAD